MNILGHLYFAEKKLDDPFYTLGLIYPDLKRAVKQNDHDIPSLREGIQEHIQTANLLHRQAWFDSLQEQLKDDIPELNFKFKKALYHWAMEIAIDYNLIKSHNAQNIIPQAEQQLQNKDLERFLLASEPYVYARVVALLEHDVLNSYATMEGCERALIRTYKRVVRKYPNLQGNVEDHCVRIFKSSHEHITPYMDRIHALF